MMVSRLFLVQNQFLPIIYLLFQKIATRDFLNYLPPMIPPQDPCLNFLQLQTGFLPYLV
jgi:hypothetical protein